MKPIAIPVVAAGPGSQPAEDRELAYLPMPKGMHTFAMPALPGAEEVTHLTEAKEILKRLRDSVAAMLDTGAECPPLDVTAMSPENLALLNQVLGEGEVSAQVAGAAPVRVQESLFAGIWRVRHYDEAGELVRDFIEVGGIPRILPAAAAAGAEKPAEIPAAEGVMNGPALLTEIRDRVAGFVSGQAAHVINFTLLPFTPEDHAWLARCLGTGPVSILSRGYGNCRVSATGIRHAWRVQYFNSVEALILDTLEIVDVPEIALAAREDIEDSLVRLGEAIDWLDGA
ncbi:MAG: hydrogenase expression/formation protein [Betaproteobacteria bacterium]|nr:hydrogenase expression/formation protein [Betaproteobacteria bacterium]